MCDDARVIALVKNAAPPKYLILGALTRCQATGKKHTYSLVVGGRGGKKDNIGLLLDLCTNPSGSQCAGHRRPLGLQMSLAKRLSLLLELAAFEPPAFHSEAFARWCCEATVALLARDSLQMRDRIQLAPGTFLAFTWSIPGMEDLPRMGDNPVNPTTQVVARGNPTVRMADGEEVNVLVVIYQMDRIGPLRVLAKGKKLGALIGFTFRQPAILQALRLPHNSRELGSYLMYEPFQRVWTRSLKPTQTLALCEGGGVMYRHPRVNVTLWLDSYVREVYPNWVRRGTGLADLLAIARSNQRAVLATSASASGAVASMASTTVSSQSTQPTRDLAAPSKVVQSKAAPSKVFRPFPVIDLAAPSKAAIDLAAPSKAAKAAPSKVVIDLAALSKAAKATPSKVVIDLAAPSKAAPTKDFRPSPVIDRAASKASKAAPTKDFRPSPVIDRAASKASNAAGSKVRLNAVATVEVVDLTVANPVLSVRKRKRSLARTEPLVDVSTLKVEEKPAVKRARLAARKKHMKGDGTKTDPYVL